MRYMQNLCEKILDQDISYEYRKLASSFLLHCYAYYGNIDGLNTCISNGAIINLKSHRGDVPLNLAIQHMHSECANRLIRVGAYVNIVTSDEDDIMHRISQMHREENFEGCSPLQLAIHSRLLDTVVLLVQYKVDIHTSFRNGETPIIYACKWGTVEIVDVLVKAGVSISDPVLIQTACQWNKRDIVEYFVEKGCLIDRQCMQLVIEYRAYDVFEFTSLSGIDWNTNSRCNNHMYEIADNASILAICKILYHKFIYLDYNTLFDMIQLFKEEKMFTN